MTIRPNLDGIQVAEESSMADRELVATRIFDAPRDLVFKAWTEPTRIGRWWGPRGFTTTTAMMDVRPGGSWRFCMHGPDGTDYENEVVYREVVAPERLVYDHFGHKDDHGADPHFKVTATFEDVGGKTRLTMRMLFPTAESLRVTVETYGADKGLSETLDRLAEYSTEKETSALSISLPSELEIVMTRRLRAPRNLVFEAFTKPEHLARWWGCGGLSLDVCEIDLRPGGAWRFVLNGPDGQAHPFKGIYREIIPGERLSYTFIYDVEMIRDHAAIETVTFEEVGGITTLRVSILHASQEARDGHLKSGMESGSGESYTRLEELLANLA